MPVGYLITQRSQVQILSRYQENALSEIL